MKPIMKHYLSLVILLHIASSAISQNISKLPKGHLVACGEDKVIVVDPKKSSDTHTEIVWSWSVSEVTNLPEEYQKLLIPLDECKPVVNNSKLLLTSSGGATILLDIAKRKVEFYAKTPMAHSVDLLPGNRIAVANSTHKAGNSLEVYDLLKPEKVIYKDTLYSGHGVVWNTKDQRLYVLGYLLLKAYSLKNWYTDQPILTLENSWALPDVGGHDLSQINASTFLISTHHGVFSFDLEKQKFTPFEPLKDKHNIKSANVSPKTQQLIYTIAEESWWTHHIYMDTPTKTINVPDIKLYKVRIAL